jgi:hypothetical protein
MTGELISIVEIDQPLCSLVYGSSPCTAAIGTTGTDKCFNTWSTCQDQDNYDGSETFTLRFCSEVENPPRDVQLIPILDSVSSRPTELNIIGADPGASPLGKRAKLSASLRDITYHDRLTDPYWRDRSYDPTTRGTFWSKWLARNRNYATYPVRVRRGTVDQALNAMQTEHFILDRIDGPGSQGSVKLTAKDVLALADNDRAVAPQPSKGRISAGISEAATVPITATLTPSRIGSEYPASGSVRIGREIFTFTRSEDTLTLTARAQNGTDAESHNADDTAQVCYIASGQRVDEVIEDLLTNYAGVDSAYINASDWGDEAATWLSTYDLYGIVSEPTGVTKLLGEILQVCTCYVWWDAENQTIRFRALRPEVTTRDVNDRQHILADSLVQETKPDERVTQLIIFYDQIDPTERQNEGANYRRARVFVPGGTRAPTDTDERVKIIHTRWLTAANEGEIVNTGVKIMQRFSEAPVKTVFSVDRSQADIELADVVDLSHYSITDPYGQPYEFPAQIIAAEYTDSGTRLRLTAVPYYFAGRFGYIVPDGTLDYLFASGNERQFGAWWSQDDGEFSNGDPAYVWL